MFDQTEVGTGHWADETRRGDVVLFRFPIRLAGDGDSPKVRPCRVHEAEEWFEERRLTFAHGTSVPASKNRGHEIPVTRPDDIRAGRLKRPTRLVGARLISAAPGNPGLDVGGTAASPIIGRLPPNRIERIEHVRARLHAEHDIAAERRRRRQQTAPTVERRQRKILVHSRVRPPDVPAVRPAPPREGRSDIGSQAKKDKDMYHFPSSFGSGTSHRVVHFLDQKLHTDLDRIKDILPDVARCRSRVSNAGVTTGSGRPEPDGS